MSTEQIIDTTRMTVDAAIQTMLLNRTIVAGVVETPNSARFATCAPTYERDEQFQRAYARPAASAEDWAVFGARFLSRSDALLPGRCRSLSFRDGREGGVMVSTAQPHNDAARPTA